MTDCDNQDAQSVFLHTHASGDTSSAQVCRTRRALALAWACQNAVIMLVVLLCVTPLRDAIAVSERGLAGMSIIFGATMGVIWCVSSALYRTWCARGSIVTSGVSEEGGGACAGHDRGAATQALANALVFSFWLILLNWCLGAIAVAAAASVGLWRMAVLRSKRFRSRGWVGEAAADAASVLALAACVWSAVLLVVNGYLKLDTAVHAAVAGAIVVLGISRYVTVKLALAGAVDPACAPSARETKQ